MSPPSLSSFRELHRKLLLDFYLDDVGGDRQNLIRFVVRKVVKVVVRSDLGLTFLVFFALFCLHILFLSFLNVRL